MSINILMVSLIPSGCQGGYMFFGVLMVFSVLAACAALLLCIFGERAIEQPPYEDRQWIHADGYWEEA